MMHGFAPLFPGGPRQVRDDARPVIQIVEGDVERVVDEAEDALIDGGRGLYQRGGSIVSVGEIKVTALGGTEGVAQQIFPVTEHALVEHLTAAAVFQRYDARRKCWATRDCPMSVARTLIDRHGRLRLPVLTGLINAPTMRPDGSILDRPGYDVTTGLLYTPRGVSFPRVAERPSRSDALAALKEIEAVFGTLPFVGPSDRAVAVSAVLTACTRNAYGTAPMHAVTAPAAGSGKSMIVDVATMIATGRKAPVIALGKTPEETEKRLVGALVSGLAAMALDNCEVGINSDLLCQILTQEAVTVRALGASTMRDIATNIFVTATGNNLTIVGDMTRRTVMCAIDAHCERPELRVFRGLDPVALARERRPALVAAALTIVRAYAAAGRPDRESPLGSFEGWSEAVRDALMWLGMADPVGTMEAGRQTDPNLQDRIKVFKQWHRAIGFDRVTTQQAIERSKLKGFDGDFINPGLHTAFVEVAEARGNIDSRRLSRWLSTNKSKVEGGIMIQRMPMVDGYPTWQLHKAASFEDEEVA